MIDQNMNLLTVDDLAKQLKVKPSWIYGETRKTGKGSIPRIKVGKYLRFRLEEVMDWLKAHQEN
jgi:excisionase family DNA binding protein